MKARIISVIAVFAMALTMTACGGGTNNETTTTAKNPDTTTTAAADTTAKEPGGSTGDAVIPDFLKGTKTEKMLATMAAGAYTMEISGEQDGAELSILTVVKGQNSYVASKSTLFSMVILSLDGTSYMLNETSKKYCKSDDSDSASASTTTTINFMDLYSDDSDTDMGMTIEKGTVEIDGTTYDTETLASTQSGSDESTSVLVFDKDGKLAFLGTPGTTAEISYLKVTRFEATADESLLAIPADFTETDDPLEIMDIGGLLEGLGDALSDLGGTGDTDNIFGGDSE